MKRYSILTCTYFVYCVSSYPIEPHMHARAWHLYLQVMSPVAMLDKLKINYRHPPFFHLLFFSSHSLFHGPSHSSTPAPSPLPTWMPVTWTSHPRPQTVSKIYGIGSSQKQSMMGSWVSNMFPQRTCSPTASPNLYLRIPMLTLSAYWPPLTPYISADWIVNLYGYLIKETKNQV